jgi:16S rRNA (adenine1518-N6/adenine1519-N6)-dimethyltransferase
MTGRDDRRPSRTSSEPAAKKKLGQHFLIDENLLGVIGRLAELDPGDVVLEVGPGLGVLTGYLADRTRQVHAVELDRSLERCLREDLAGRHNVELTFGDALRLDLAALEPPPTKLVSNLPYNIATPLVVESLDGLPSVELWTVLVQREVADRFFARPSTKAYGAVSVLVQLAAERTGFHPVSRTVFRPQPNVDSALLAFRRRSLPESYPRVKQVVGAGFAHRRKRLPNSLELAGVASREQAAAALELIGRDPGARAEELAPPEFVSLAEALDR